VCALHRPGEWYHELPGTAGKKAEKWIANQAVESGDLGADNLQSMDPGRLRQQTASLDEFRDGASQIGVKVRTLVSKD
jgi:hypothetical protein